MTQNLLAIIGVMCFCFLGYIFYILKNHSNKEKNKKEEREQEDLSSVSKAKIAELNSLQKAEKVESIADRLKAYQTAVHRKEGQKVENSVPLEVGSNVNTSVSGAGTPIGQEKTKTTENLSFEELKAEVLAKINNLQYRRKELQRAMYS